MSQSASEIASWEQELATGIMHLVDGDATRLDLRQLVASQCQPGVPVKVVANLPFNITTDILKILLPMGDIIKEVFVMLQVSVLPKLRQLSLTIAYVSHPVCSLQQPLTFKRMTSRSVMSSCLQQLDVAVGGSSTLDRGALRKFRLQSHECLGRVLQRRRIRHAHWP
jgi:hypothetical protein